MKRFATLLTVSITMAAVAFADHPVVEPDLDGGVGFPFHPGAYIANTLSSDYAWHECFCMPIDPANPNYVEFPATGDPTLIDAYDVMRMNRTFGAGFNANTYLQSPAGYAWDGLVLDMTFYFAVQETANALGYYITPAALAAAPATPTAPAGLAFIIDRVGVNASITVYDGGVQFATAALPVADNNFHLIRIRYDEFWNKVRVDLFDVLMMIDINIIDWTDVPTGLNAGYLGFGGFVPADGAYQYIDDICLNITDENGYVVDAFEQPASFSVAQNYPNPFNPSTTISFTMPENGVASLKVFDLAGREVATLVNGFTARGDHNVVFDASKLNSGVYFYTFESAGVSQTQKMVLVK